LSIPWNPVTTATVPPSSAACTRAPPMPATSASPCRSVVRMPACRPVSETAGTPSPIRDMAISAADSDSPTASNWSSSRDGPAAPTSAASRSRSSVRPPRAETTTATADPRRRAVAIRWAACRTQSRVRSEVPPYFCTSTSTVVFTALVESGIAADSNGDASG
jgi:hypothetical protein